MCGDIDEEARLGDEIVARLLALAGRRYGIDVDNLSEAKACDIASDADRHAFMDESFRDGLATALAQLEALPEGQRAEGLASQAIVLARLAGLLAGNLPPGSDLLRTVMEAMLDGYGEPARAFAETAEHHHHDHHRHEHGHRH